MESGSGLDRVAICMATYNPNPDLFRAQVESIREQTDGSWTCFISDDASGAEAFGSIEEILDGDPRFIVSRSSLRAGFYRNFERALGMVPDEFGLVALCDQDDRWHPDKLESLRAGLGSAQLVYSDQRLIDESGAVIAETYWGRRSNNYTDLISLLVANTVTGAASLFRRGLLDLVLPFPEVPGEQYHDHWIALVALSIGEIAYVDRPLYDYVQHGSAVLGHDRANRPAVSSGWRRLDPRQWPRIVFGWGSVYFDVYLRLQALVSLILARAGDRIPAGKRTELIRFQSSDRSPREFLRLALRPLRALYGHDETMGAERLLVRAILYRAIMRFRGRLPDRAVRVLSTGRARVAPIVAESERIRNKIQPLALGINRRTEPRVNLLIPSIDLDHLFGGYIAKFNLARRLAESGHRVRIVAVDPDPEPAPGWKQRVESYSGLDGLFDRVEVAFGRSGGVLEMNPEDRVIATTWWTALIAARMLSQIESDRFVYLIQEYEPLTVPPGSWAALAESSYRLPHFALFSTELLRDFFRQRRYGVFAESAGRGDRDSVSFKNAITPVEPAGAGEIGARESRSLLFYARPEPHAARNMFEIGMLALRLALEDKAMGDSWRLRGIGSIDIDQPIPVMGEVNMEMVPRTSQAAYGSMLAGHDVGLALMYAPHPSLVPLEMASAGLVTVTNTFETKTTAAMEDISPNLIAADPDPESIAAGLIEAVGRCADGTARVAGSELDWATEWDEAFDDELIGRLDAVLRDG